MLETIPDIFEGVREGDGGASCIDKVFDGSDVRVSELDVYIALRTMFGLEPAGSPVIFTVVAPVGTAVAPPPFKE